jgi:hypothetical protein
VNRASVPVGPTPLSTVLLPALAGFSVTCGWSQA